MSEPTTCGSLGYVTAAGKPCQRPAQDGGPCYQHRGTTPDELAALVPERVSMPQDWDKAVSAAYLWLVCDEVKGSAEAAGVGLRTMHRWIHSDWWPRACAEAKTRWLNHLTAEARRTLMRAIRDKDDARTAWDVLQQFDDDFRPRPKEVRVLGVLAFVEQLSDDLVRHIMGMPQEQRRGELVKLAKESGVELAGG